MIRVGFGAVQRQRSSQDETIRVGLIALTVLSSPPLQSNNVRLPVGSHALSARYGEKQCQEWRVYRPYDLGVLVSKVRISLPRLRDRAVDVVGAEGLYPVLPVLHTQLVTPIF